MNADARIGAACIINTGATIDHDCVIGEGVHICPGAHLAGDVRVGDRSWIGIAATIRQGITVGRDAWWAPARPWSRMSLTSRRWRAFRRSPGELHMSIASADQDRPAGNQAQRLISRSGRTMTRTRSRRPQPYCAGRVNYWTGTEGRRFEQEYARAIGVRYAVALANGTVALELALAMLGIGPGDEVITSPRTFIASASCAVMRGAKPVFADVDRDSQNITAASIEQVVRRARAPSSWCTWPVGPARWTPSWSWQEAGILRSSRIAPRRTAPCIEAAPSAASGFSAHFPFARTRSFRPAAKAVCWRRTTSRCGRALGPSRIMARATKPSIATIIRRISLAARILRHQLAYDGDSGGHRPAATGETRRLVGRRRANAQRLHEGLREMDALRIPLPDADMRHAYYKFYAFLDWHA